MVVVVVVVVVVVMIARLADFKIQFFSISVFPFSVRDGVEVEEG